MPRSLRPDFAFPSPPLVLLAVAAALAGCAGDAPSPGPDEPAADAGTGWHETFAAHGTTVVAYRSNPTVFADTFPRTWFNVTANTTGLLVELVWHDPAQDLDATAYANVDGCHGLAFPDDWACTVGGFADSYDFGEVRDRGGTPGAPDSPSRAFADAARLQEILAVCGDPCQFASYPRPHQLEPVVAGIEWWNYVTLFRGPVPEGFTAVPDA
jgi:hypothetical protein